MLPTGQSGHSEQLVHTRSSHGFGHTIDTGVELEIATDREILVQGEPLAHVSDVLFDPFATGGNVEIEHTRAAARGFENAAQHPDRRALTGAVRSNQSKHFALCDMK